MVDAILKLLVAAGSEQASGHIEAGPVEGILVVGWLVDKLWPELLPLTADKFGVDTDIDLVTDLYVDVGLDGDFALLVVVDTCLLSNE